jgi:hypothetical protein
MIVHYIFVVGILLSVFRETHIMYLIRPVECSEDGLFGGGGCYWYIMKCIMYR